MEWAKKRAAAVLAVWRSRIAKRQVDEQRDATTGLRPDDAAAFYNRGNSKMAFHRFEDAIADYDAAIELRPDYAGAYCNRGNAKMVLDKTDEARSDFKKALDLATEKISPR